ncbi:MAG: OmpH family outer membrane protein [Planctomycetota bacterium]|nr:OmpH family outer membrane protein [Planctomycetota bacterium]MDA1105982.1 OmpH family outer membrane protein [Planctomycetota bacterium]
MNRLTSSIVAGLAGGAIATALVSVFASAPWTSASIANATGSPAAEDLGPATTLVLAGEPEVRVSAKDGRMSWGTEAGARGLTIAAVNTGKVLGAILQSERFEERRAQFKEEVEKAGRELEARFAELQNKYQGTKPDSPEAGEARAAMQAFQQEYQEFMARTQQAEGTLAAEQYTEAYGDMRTAVEVICDRRKIDLVYRFIPPDEKIAPSDMDTLTLQIQARTFIKLPEGLDITVDVLKEMNLSAE